MNRPVSRWTPLAALVTSMVLRTALAADAGAPPDGGAGDTGAAVVPIPPPAAAEAVSPPPPAPPPAAHRVDELTVVGTAESRTAGSAHVLRSRDLERMNYDNPETVVRAVPGVYARGEDGFGLRPNIGIRGTAPDRSKKITLMEDGILFGPAPYSAPAAYYFPLITRMELVRVIKGPGAVVYGPQTIAGAIDFVTRGIPYDEAGGVDLAAGQYGYGKFHGFYGASTARSGYVLEGIALRSSGFKQLDGGGNTGFERSEWMWKGRYQLSNDPQALQEVRLKLGYSEEDSRETYLGLTDADLRANPLRRYRASLLDRMQWHRTQLVATYNAQWRRAFTLNIAAYRNDFQRTWRKVNRMGAGAIADILADPTGQNAVHYAVLTGAANWENRDDTIYIGPNRRLFVSQGIQAVATWQGATGPVVHRAEAGLRFHYDRIDRLHTEDGFRMTDGVLVPDKLGTITNVDERAWTHALAMHVIDAATVGPLTMTPGFRVELISTWLRDRKAGTEVEGSPQRVFIPGFGLYGALRPGLGLLGGVYRGFSPAAPAQPAAVHPELSTNYEAGIRWTPRRFRLEAIGFYNDYQNLTSVCAAGEGCGATQSDTQYDAGRARIMGVELFGRGDLPLGGGFVVPVTASYTFTSTRLLDTFTSGDPTLGDVVAGDELPFVPNHLFAATVGLDGPSFGLAAAATYISAMREHAGQGPQEPLLLARPWTDPSWLFDVTARVAVGKRGSIYVNVRNLFDAHDITARLPFGARPVAPRWAQVGTTWSF